MMPLDLSVFHVLLTQWRERAQRNDTRGTTQYAYGKQMVSSAQRQCADELEAVLASLPSPAEAPRIEFDNHHNARLCPYCNPLMEPNR